MLVGRVIDDELDENLDVPRVRRAHQRLKIVERPVRGMDVQIIGNVIPVISKRRREEGQQPQAGDADILQVVELLREALKIADAVVVAVEERLHVGLVDDGVLVPEGIVAGDHRLANGLRDDCEIGNF